MSEVQPEPATIHGPVEWHVHPDALSSGELSTLPGVEVTLPEIKPDDN